MDNNLFIKELAERLGVSEDTITNWEIRNIIPRHKYIRKLRELLLLDIPASLVYKDYPTTPVTFGQKVKQKRLNLHLAQKELGQKLGVSVDTIRDWENERRPVKDGSKKLEKILEL